MSLKLGIAAQSSSDTFSNTARNLRSSRRYWVSRSAKARMGPKDSTPSFGSLLATASPKSAVVSVMQKPLLDALWLAIREIAAWSISRCLTRRSAIFSGWRVNTRPPVVFCSVPRRKHGISFPVPPGVAGIKAQPRRAGNSTFARMKRGPRPAVARWWRQSAGLTGRRDLGEGLAGAAAIPRSSRRWRYASFRPEFEIEYAGSW